MAQEEVKQQFIRQFPLFGKLKEEEVQQVAELLEVRRKDRFSYVYQPGEPSDTVFFLIKGAAKIGTHSPDGKEVIKALVHPVSVLGELGIVGEERRQDFAQVLKEDATFYTLPVVEFKRLMRGNYELCNEVMLLFGQRLIKAERKLESLIFKDARTRIIEFIKETVRSRGQQVGYEMLLKHSLTHQDIANITCTSRQTVTLVLNELKKLDLIHFNRGRILVRDMKRLA